VPYPASIGGQSPTICEQCTPSPIVGDKVAPVSIGDPNSNAEHNPPLHNRPMIEPVNRG